MKRISILVASVVMQMALGGVYAWSTYVPALRADYGLSAAQAGTIFGTTIAVFTLTMTIAGRFLDSVGPARMSLVGGLFYGGGYLAAGYSSGDWFWIWLGIGVLSGVGIGFGYVCPLTTCVRWYPERKGLVTGLAVAGFGGGAIVLSEVAEGLMASGWSPLRVFRAMGIVLSIIVVACGQLLSFPPGAGTSSKVQGKPISIWRDAHLRRLALGMFAGTFGGLLAIGHLKPIALSAGLSSAAGALAVSAFAVGNAAGRLVWGSIFDRLGYRVIPLSLGFLAFVLLGLLDDNVAWRFIGASLVAGFGFGSCFVVYAAEVASAYGPERVPVLYPKIFLAYGVAGITGPMAGGWLFDITQSYLWPVLAAAAVTAAGAIGTSRGHRPHSSS